MHVVIGAAGQVGQEFIRLLGPDRVRGLTRAEVDVTDEASVDRALAALDCSSIINLAAFHDVNGCEAQPDRAFTINATGAANVARAAKRRGCPVVYFSSDYVFGRDRNRQSPYVESDRPDPLNVYGTSKAAGEDAVASIDAHCLIVRTSSLFGITTSRKGWTFPEMILQRVGRGQPLRVVTDQHMAPTYTRDLVEAVITLLDVRATGIVHVVNDGGCSWYELASATLALAGIEHPIEPVASDAFPAAAIRPSYSRLASERLGTWNVQPLRHWKAALEAYLREKRLLPVTVSAAD